MAPSTSARVAARAWHHLIAPLRWIERSRGWRRSALAALYLSIAFAMAALVWRYTCLHGLPDIGDPAALDAFRKRGTTGAAGSTAILLYGDAVGKLVPYSGTLEQGMLPWQKGKLFFETPISNARFASTWSKATPELRRWVESNPRALEALRRAPGTPAVSTDGVSNFAVEASYYSLLGLALLEGSRHEESGKMDEAWGWYRSVLRAVRHLGNADPLRRRFRLERFAHPVLRSHVERWADDPRTSVDLLRRALADVLAVDRLVDRDEDCLIIEYVRTKDALENPTPEQAESVRQPLAQSIRNATRHGSFGFSHGLSGMLAVPAGDALRFVLNEPERSRRVMRLFYANWIENVSSLKNGTGTILSLETSYRPHRQLLLVPRPGVTPKPGGLAPDQLAAWHESTMEARLLLPDIATYYRALHARSVNQGTLVMRLAEELYAREHSGSRPPTPDALVGPYLESLPDQYEPAMPSARPN